MRNIIVISHVALNSFSLKCLKYKATVAGRQGDCYILPILEGSASIARDCKRDIYSRFLHINLHIYIYIYLIYTHTTIHSCTSIITSYHLYTFNRLLLHLIIVYLFLVCILLLLYVYICVCLLFYCLVS
jgi:hypothetical protein